MNKIFAVLILMFSSVVVAVDADFSKAFVIPDASGFNKLSIGGIDAIETTYKVGFALRDDLTLAIADAATQDSLAEQLEQSLRNTQWQGTYDINGAKFTTTLTLAVVQDGYVGGEIIHSRFVEQGRGFLHARVTGDIITQFEIDGIFVDEDRITADILATLTDNTPNRQLIRIKRMRALEFENESSSWSTNREYRLILENGVLVGSAGVPNDVYGSSDGTSDNGVLSLTQQ